MAEPSRRTIAQSDDDRLRRIAEIIAEMAELQRQKQDAFRIKLRREVDLQTFNAVTKEMDTALDQLDGEHKSLTSEAAMPELPDASLAWEELSAVDRRALTEMLVDKIIIERHPSMIDQDGRHHYTIRAIPYQDPSRWLSGLRRCMKRGSRSSPGSEQHQSLAVNNRVEATKRVTRAP